MTEYTGRKNPPETKKVYKQGKCDEDNKVYKNNTLTTKTAVNVLKTHI